MSVRRDSSFLNALEEANDASLNKLRYEHKMDMLWAEMKFGDWVELRLAFVEERGYTRGFTTGVKAAQARVHGVGQPWSDKQRFYFWLLLTPCCAVILAFLALVVIRAVREESFWLVALVCTVGPLFAAVQVLAAWSLLIMAVKRASGSTEGVVFAKTPVDTEDVSSTKGVKDISHAIAKAEFRTDDSSGSVEQDEAP